MHVPGDGDYRYNRDPSYGLPSLNTEIHWLARVTGNVPTPFVEIHISIYLCIFEFTYCQEPQNEKKTMELHHCDASQLPFTKQPEHAEMHGAARYMVGPILFFFGYRKIRPNPENSDTPPLLAPEPLRYKL